MGNNKKDDSQLPIIIIGAGAAGLTAAEELQKAGHDYLVLEGRDRIGGRIHTQNWPLTHPTLFELGAAWFHGVPQNRLAYVAEEEGFESAYDDDQTVIYDMQGKLDQDLVNRISQKFDEFRQKRDPSDPLDQVATLFMKDLTNEDEKRVAKAVAYGYQLAAGLRAQQIGAQFEAPGGRDKAVQNGYIKIFEDLLAKDVDHSKVKLKTKATHITTPKEGDKVQISTQDGQHFEGKAVIVTVPIGVLKNPGQSSIQFEPRLSGPILKAINNTEVAHVDKVYLTFPTAFWNPTTYKFVVSDEINPALVWNWEATHPGTQQKNTLAVLVTNETALSVQQHPDEAFDVVKPILKAIAPGADIPEPTQVIHSSWVTDEFSLGSFSVVPHGHTREELAEPFINGEPRSRLLFAGEHAIVDGAGLVQGAWESGKRAAQQALDL